MDRINGSCKSSAEILSMTSFWPWSKISALSSSLESCCSRPVLHFGSTSHFSWPWSLLPSAILVLVSPKVHLALRPFDVWFLFLVLFFQMPPHSISLPPHLSHFLQDLLWPPTSEVDPLIIRVLYNSDGEEAPGIHSHGDIFPFSPMRLCATWRQGICRLHPSCHLQRCRALTQDP